MKKDIYAKIKKIDELTPLLGALRKKGKKISHCHGVFDLLHPGHLKHFEAAKKKADVLVVTVTRDEYVNKGPGRPVFNQDLRAESIAAIECVDYVAINDWPTATETIKRLRPHFYVKGNDYAKRQDDITAKIYEEEEAVKSVGGAMYFTDEVSFSSSSLINMFLTPYPEEARNFFLDFRKRYACDRIINTLKAIAGVKVLVIGDVIIDEYHYCVGMAKAQKDNIIATKFVNDEIFAGGVLAAANHIAGFCKDVTLVSCLGQKNDYKDFIKTHLRPNIKTNFYDRQDAPTVVKRRFVEPNFLTKLFEICYLEDAAALPPALESRVCDYLDRRLKDFDMVLVADFGHGFITPKIVQTLCEKANFLAVNVQTNSANIGFNLITKFPRVDYICIDEAEIRFACHDRFSDLKQLVRIISKKLNCHKIIITRGHKGSLVYSKKEGFKEVSIFSKEIVDRIGAGDAYFSITAPCVFKDNPMEVIGFIGNAVGAMKVLIVGNRLPVEPVPLFKYIATLLK
ncbi:MAG: adenylyltransferase/cytidyltransferase family protein [Candidatus Omnitrophica bacterium]|nr:adenylyltransferase/cytidyltransferase family protein [Candidatus Omnitrophota bacterium]